MSKNQKAYNEMIKRCTNAEGMLVFEDLAREMAELNGLDEQEVLKVLHIFKTHTKKNLELNGEADFLLMGKLAVSTSPDVDYDFIPYPEEVRRMKWQLLLQRISRNRGFDA